VERITGKSRKRTLKAAPDCIVTLRIKEKRAIIKWPETLSILTDRLDPEQGSKIPGKVQHLSEGLKKIAPLELSSITDVLNILSLCKTQFKQQGRRLKVDADDEFRLWLQKEHDAAKTRGDAETALTYNPNTIQVDYPELKIPLHHWQSSGVEFIDIAVRDGEGVLVCDRTGLGKTYTAGAHLALNGYRGLVVCPAGLRTNWAEKLAHLTSLSTYIVGSDYPKNCHKADVIIISYDMLRKWAMLPLTKIVEKQKRVLILDEAHLIRNLDALRTQYAQHLAEKARHTLPLTATPLVNRTLELYSLLECTRRNWSTMTPKQFNGYYGTTEGRREIADRLKGIMVRRHAEDVMKDMPTSETGALWLELSNRKDYIDATNNFIGWLRGKGATLDELDRATRGHCLVKLNKLRELSAFGKIDGAQDVIESALDAGEQIVVFCSFNEPLRALEERFRHHTGTNIRGEQWRGSGIINGKVPEKKRQKLIRDFQAGKIGMLALGIKSGGLGIDLPAACIGYFLDLPWTPADLDQAKGRLHRLGQTRNCQFFKLLAQNSIDSQMEEILYRKAGIFAQAIGDERAIDRVSAKNVEDMKRSDVLDMILQSYLKISA